jgi:hypothetical protein
VRDQRPIQTARRKTRQRDRENRGIAVPPCPLCIQSHHTAGRNHDDELIAQICETHHRAIHEQILRAGISLEYEPDPVKRVALALRAASVYDRARADAMERWASLLDHNLEAKS